MNDMLCSKHLETGQTLRWYANFSRELAYVLELDSGLGFEVFERLACKQCACLLSSSSQKLYSVFSLSWRLYGAWRPTAAVLFCGPRWQWYCFDFLVFAMLVVEQLILWSG